MPSVAVGELQMWCEQVGDGHLFLWQDPAAHPVVIDFLHDTGTLPPD